MLAECHLPSQGEMVDLSPEYSKTASSNKPWLTHAVAHLTGGVAAATSDRGVHALQSLGVYRATNKCLEELHMCDAERKVCYEFILLLFLMFPICKERAFIANFMLQGVTCNS